jgi:hypothetical protein
MSRDEIILLVYKNRQFSGRIKELTKDLFEDAFQEFMMIICQTNPIKLENAYNDGKIDNYVQRIITRNFKYKTGLFFTKYIKPSKITCSLEKVKEPENIPDPEEQNHHEEEETVREIVERLPNKADENLINSFCNNDKDKVSSKKEVASKVGCNRNWTGKRFEDLKKHIKDELPREIGLNRRKRKRRKNDD